MNSRFYFIVLFFYLVNCYCAYSFPFVVKGKRWHIRSYNQKSLLLRTWGEEPDEEYDLCFDENCDTVIDNKVYSKLTYHNCALGKEPKTYSKLDNDNSVRALLREEKGKVYFYAEKTKKEYLLYDFTLNKSDSFTMEAIDGTGEYNCYVEDVSYIIRNGIQLKKILLSSSFTDYQHGETEGPVLTEWIEGFGGKTPVCQPNTEKMAGGVMEIMSYVTYSDNTFIPNNYDYLYFKGQQLVLGQEVTDEVDPEKKYEDELRYEFTDDYRLHVHGVLWSYNNPNQYLHCTIRQGDSASIYNITFDRDVLEPTSDCIGAFIVDFYFDDFYLDPYKNIECHIHDNAGVHIIYLNNTQTNIPNIFQQRNNKIIYDLSGRRLTSPPNRGIYIENGRKKVGF